MILVASAVNLVHARAVARDRTFAEWHQLRRVASVVLPTAVYVAAIPWLGLYLSSAILITAFMVWLGHYRLLFSLSVAAVVMGLTYLTFEQWFLVPLPKGLVEDLLAR